MRTLATLLFAVGFVVPAAAADLPLKAAAQPRLIPVCGNGGYLGINTMGAAGTVDNSPVPGASIIQGEIGVTLGYTGTIGACVPGVANPFWFIEQRIDFANLNGATNGLSLSGPLHLQQRIGYGNPAITTMLSSIPFFSGFSVPSLPVLPAGVTSTTSVPYLAFAVNEQDVSAQLVTNDPNICGQGAMATPCVFQSNKVWEVSPEIQIGIMNRLSNSVVVDVHAGYQVQASGVCFGALHSCPGMGNKWTAGVSFDF